jgi:hypothetical protein
MQLCVVRPLFAQKQTTIRTHGGVGIEPGRGRRRNVGTAARPTAFAIGARLPPAQWDQLSKKLRSLRLRLGCLSLRSALASIWRMRSRVTENC